MEVLQPYSHHKRLTNHLYPSLNYLRQSCCRHGICSRVVPARKVVVDHNFTGIVVGVTVSLSLRISSDR